jgi:hypothetical protein
MALTYLMRAVPALVPAALHVWYQEALIKVISRFWMTIS